MKRRGAFSDAFIKKALITWTKMAAEGKTNLEVAKHIGCHPSMLYYWNARAVGKGWQPGPSRRAHRGGHGRQHTDEFKRRAVSAVLNRGELTVLEVARGLGVSHALLYRWVHLTGVPNTKVGYLRLETPASEVTRLRVKCARLLDQIAVLREAVKLLTGRAYR